MGQVIHFGNSGRCFAAFWARCVCAVHFSSCALWGKQSQLEMAI